MKIQVVGAGSFGLALTKLLAQNGHQVSILCRQEDNPDTLRKTRERPDFLPGVLLPDSVEVVTDTESDVDMAVLAVPSHVMRLVVGANAFSPETIRVSVAKGIEEDSLMRMDEVIHQVCGACPMVALSGPSHAEEVGRERPTIVCAASADSVACEKVQEAFRSSYFKVYTTQDIIGVELGGALKNVIAIAAGVCDGLGLGDNALAALMTRGLAEMSRLGVAMGADPLTFSGLSGMGDLIVTCSSQHSRNRAVGTKIASGMTLKEALADSPMVAEGVRTTKSAHALAQRHGVEMPITHQVHRVLFEDADPRQAITQLMMRESRSELE
ncbi:MAG: glycerol-3-phosphate dehydrogenase [Candidatus Hydrogenedentota bacterium]|nr:MAG: glycerol-3-phosphate dehydrogenase [Candidatus Hydrogenedentota bacterium]